MHTDIQKLDLIEKLPGFMQPYAYLARMDRPVGWWLLLIPALWSIGLASGGFWDLSLREIAILVLFFIGAILMRSAGCVVNDLWDRDLDQSVERTSQRPLASGEVGMTGAIIFLGILLLLAALILFSLNTLTIILGLLSLPLIALYPLMKRLTYWPQAFLGITFNMSILMGWSAITGNLWSLTPFILYAAGFLWTLAYDTVYAHQDAEDDMLAGIKSSALKLAEYSKAAVFLFYAVSMVLVWLALILEEQPLYATALLIPAAIFMGLQLVTWDKDDAKSCLRRFKSNRIYGLLIALACFI